MMMPWTAVVVLLSVAAALLVASLAVSRADDPSRPPRVRVRDLPKLRQGAAEPELITLAGRTYQVERTTEPRGVCTWCQRPPAAGEEVVRCPNPHCRSISHRQHAEENGGCGGICNVLR